MIPLVTLAVVAVVAIVTYLLPKTYQSQLQFFVSTVDTSNSAQLAQGNTFLQQRVKSYSQLLTAPIVLQPVVKDVGINASPEALAGDISAAIPTDTVLINVTVTDRDPNRAQRIAGAIGSEFPKTVKDLETVSSSSSPVKVTLTQEPTLDMVPVSPKPIRNVALAVVLGLFLGVGIALMRHMLDTKVRTKEDVEELAEGLTVIGAIPFDSEAPKHPLLVEAGPQSSRAESFRSLRTNLAFVDVANHPRSIVMTSTLAGEGKTTTTANLAVVLADSGASVCLIEGDLRRPRLLEYFGLEGAVGLTDVLIGRAELSDVLQPYGKRSLFLLGAGQIPPNPSELLGSPAMRKTLDELSETFDYLLIDAPPLLPVTDAAVLSTLVGGALMVVGSGLVTRDQLAAALDSLQAVNGRLLGIALNRVPRSARAGGYYDYQYAYGADPRRRQEGSDDDRPLVAARAGTAMDSTVERLLDDWRWSTEQSESSDPTSSGGVRSSLHGDHI